jgi:hypothetical protein
LPTVAGGLIASAGAADVGQRRLAEVMLGLGMICWLVLGSIILARLLFRPLPPGPLLPTLASAFVSAGWDRDRHLRPPLPAAHEAHGSCLAHHGTPSVKLVLAWSVHRVRRELGKAVGSWRQSG